MEPEYLTLFTNTGNFTIQVRFKNSYSSVATQKMKADEIKNLLNLDGESFISKMRFDDHLAEIEKIRDEGTLEELILPVDRVFEGKTKLTVVPEAFRFLQNGNRLNDGNFTDVPEKIADGEQVLVYDPMGHFYAVYQYERETKDYKVRKMFGA